MPANKQREAAKADIFARAIHEGKSQRQAFRESHPDSKSSLKGMDEQGCKWANSDKVLTRLADLEAQARENAIIQDRQAQAELSNIALSADVATRDRLSALDQLAKRQGCYTDKHEITGGVKVDAALTVEDARAAFLAEFRDKCNG